MKGKKKFSKTKGWIALLVLFIFATVQSAYAIGTHNSNVTPASAYTEFAELFPSVGFLFATDAEAETSFSSGVLIHPNFALTSGHGTLINDGDASTTYDSYLFGLGANSSTEATEFLSTTEVFHHPGYTGIEQGVDLSLLYFETPFTTVAPAEIYDRAVQDGDIAAIVGYGQTGTPATGAAPTLDGVKRAGENIIESVTFSDDYLFYRFSRPGDANFLELGSQALPGDSGGGWFIQDEDSFYLAGITSGGSPDSAFAASSSAVQVGLYTDWINDTIASRTAVPEPTSMALLGIGGLIGAVRRRKRQA